MRGSGPARRAALRWGWLLVPGLAAALYLAIWGRFRLAPAAVAVAGDDRRAAVLLPWLRAALRDGLVSAPPPSMTGSLRLPLWVSLFREGALVARARAEQPTWRAAARSVLRALAADAAVRELGQGDWDRLRLKLDVGISAGPVAALPALLLAHSFVPGLDAVVLQVGQRRAYLLPDDQQRLDLLAGYQPVSFMGELRSGLDVQGALNLLTAELDLTREDWRALPHRWSRLRVRSYVDDPATRRVWPIVRDGSPSTASTGSACWRPPARQQTTSCGSSAPTVAFNMSTIRSPTVAPAARTTT